MDLLHVRNRKNYAFVYDLAAAIVRKVYEVVVGQKVFPLSSIRNVYILHIKVIIVANILGFELWRSITIIPV